MIVYFNARAATCAAALCAVFVGFCREAPWQDVEAATGLSGAWTMLYGMVPGASMTKNCMGNLMRDLPMKNGGLPMKNGDLPQFHGLIWQLFMVS